MSIDATTLVTQQLALVGIAPSQAEAEALIAAAPARAAEMDAMYTIGEARYEEPGLTFSALSPS